MRSDGPKALILAGGKGTRLAPYTTVLPKPLMPIDDSPILEIVLRQLQTHGFSKVYISVGHLAELIMAFFGNGEKLDLDIEYLIEDTPLGTVGCLRLVPGFDAPLLVMNGDVLTDLNYCDLYQHHADNDELLTIATCKRHVDVNLGVLEYTQNGLVERFREKPRLSYDVSMGVYVMDPGVLNFIPDGEPYGFDRLMTDLLRARMNPRTYLFDGHWLDIGRIEDYEVARDCFLKFRSRFLPERVTTPGK